MTRYHVNNAGDPGVCRATNKCPFGDIESDHYDSVPEARAAYEAKMTGGDTLTSVSKASNRDKTGDVKLPNSIKVLGRPVATVRDGVEHIRAEYAKVEYARDVTPEMVIQELGGTTTSLQDSYFEPVGTETHLVIESYETDPIDGVEPVEVEEEESFYQTNEPAVYKSRYKVDGKTAQEIKDFEVKRSLENIVETSHRKDLPMWAAIPASQGVHYPARPSSLHSADPEKAARRVEAMENKIRGLEKNLKKDEERAEKLKVVEADVETLSEAAREETRPAVKHAIEVYQATLEASAPKLKRQVRRNDPEALKKELKSLKRAAATANEAFAKVQERDFRAGLASHYPSTDPKARARAADAWIKDNPAVVKSGWNYSF